MHQLLIGLIVLVILGFSACAVYSNNLKSYPPLAERNQSSGGRQYFVNPKNGDDTNSGLDSAHAWKSGGPINAMKLTAGDSVELSPGEYRQSLVIVGEGTTEKPITIHFRAGEYDFYPDSAFTQKLHITNTNDDPHGDKHIAIAFIHAKHVRVSADANTDFFMHGKMMHVLLDQAEDITFENLNFDFRRPTMSEFTVGDVDERSAILNIHRDSSYTIENNRLIWVGHGWRYAAPGYCQQGITEFGSLWRSANPLARATKVEAISPGVVKAHFDAASGFIKGRVFQDRQTKRDCAGVFARNSKDVTWRNCNFYSIHGMGLVNQFVENLTLDHVHFVPRPGSGRTGSCWADAVQVMACRGEFLADSCTFSGLHDDPINVHGTFLRIVQRVSDHQIIVRFMHPQTYGFAAFFSGDQVGFVRGDSVQTFALGQVKEAILQNEREMLITLESPVPTDIKDRDVLENLTWTPSVTIRRCHITMDSCRGLLLTSPRRMVVEGNTFFNTSMHAILIEGNATGWFESGPVRDVLIRDNIFLTTPQTCIEIAPGNTTHAGPVHRNIRIENNFFQLTNNLAVNATSVQGLRIRGNRFSTGKVPVQHRDCEDVTIDENVLNATK